MSKRLLFRLLQLVGVVIAVAVLNFFLLKALPGDLVDVIASESGSAAPELIQHLRELYGLDRNLFAQLMAYLGELARGNLGFSFRFGEPVLDLILDRMPATLLLVGAALILSVTVGVLLGIASARRPHGAADTVISALATIGYSAPMFWVALMLIVLFAVKLSWLPASGWQDINAGYTGLRQLWDIAAHLVLPVLTLAIYYMAVYARLSRASMIETLSEDFIRTAWAKGAREQRVLFRHALRHALLPVITMLGLQSSALLGGSIVVETVFAWPGLGQLSFDAIRSRDIPVLLGVLLFSSVLVVLSNLAVDMVHAWLDPRVRIVNRGR
ncbi:MULTISPECIES: ABC transporter permease [unclassified Brenneria]|uniref:ABC transporter permease n=1 Tax=unclassified Brenneria TaxID=2634434 RepID=UPI0015534BD9|nr:MULTISPECIES: ABC transporter permease [unclassified Brenneria]MBJ7221039.1 ABC transporter permease [Brenneria sp. L3-3C-1]MEE3642280.1 ABC transporter permease [Brenneria sp. L3_3C_1]MEE3650348.1 ABC transporter permease [Brenneria sp. HEZEL_4_2_4]NPD00304.1 ABC transporter permease [Brenneria sp. hezel4-2-4]